MFPGKSGPATNQYDARDFEKSSQLIAGFDIRWPLPALLVFQSTARPAVHQTAAGPDVMKSMAKCLPNGDSLSITVWKRERERERDVFFLGLGMSFTLSITG